MPVPAPMLDESTDRDRAHPFIHPSTGGRMLPVWTQRQRPIALRLLPAIMLALLLPRRLGGGLAAAAFLPSPFSVQQHQRRSFKHPASPSPAVLAAKRRQLLRRRAQGGAADPTAPLAGSVKLYDRHVVVLDPVRGHERWPTHLEESGYFQVAHYVQAKKTLAAQAQAVGEGGPERTYGLKVTVAEALGHAWAAPQDDQDPATTYPELHSVLLFGPGVGQRGVVVRGVRRGDVPTLVEALVTTEDLEKALTAESLLGDHVQIQVLQGHDILVCAHASRDARCKACGPALVEALRSAVEIGQAGGAEEKEEEEIRVWRSSHVGGHRYAGNALVMSSGDWFGNLKAEESAAWREMLQGLQEGSLADKRFAPPLRAHWRGCTGLDEVQQEAAVVAARGGGSQLIG